MLDLKTCAGKLRRLLGRRGRGASLAETGILVGLIAVVSITAVGVLGGKVENVFCVAAEKLGAEVTCDEIAHNPGDTGSGGNNGGSEEPDANTIVARMIDGMLDISAGDTEISFGIKGLVAGYPFTWEVRDGGNRVVATGSGTRDGAENMISLTLADARSGYGHVIANAVLPNGNPATHNIPYTIGVTPLPLTSRLLDDDVAAGGANDRLVLMVGGLIPDAAFTWEVVDKDGNVVAHGSGVRAAFPAETRVDIDLSGIETSGPLEVRVSATLPDGSTVSAVEEAEVLALDEFVDLSGREPGTIEISNSIAAAGLGGSAAATVSNGAVIVRNGVAAGGSTTLADGDTVALQVTVPTAFDTAVVPVLSVGGFERDWQVRSRPETTNLATLQFNDVFDADPGATVTSNVAAVTGFTGTLPVSVSGPAAQLRINGGSWTTSGNLAAGDRIQLQLVAATQSLDVVTATASIGSQTFPWKVRTVDLGPTVTPFQFQPRSGAEPLTVYATSAVMKGFSGPRQITVSGDDAQIRIGNSDSWVTSGSVRRNTTVTLRMRATSGFLAPKTATVTAGETAADWLLVTRATSSQPNGFSIPTLVNQEPSTQVLSAAVTPTGFDVPVTFTVSGDGSPALSTDGSTFAASLSVTPGQVIQLRATTTGTYGASRAITVSYGSRTSTWAIITRAADTSPDAFVFPDSTDLDGSTLTTSTTVVPTGFEAPVTVSLGGSGDTTLAYSVAGGDWQTANSTIQPGQSLALRTQSATWAQAKTVSVIIGGQRGTWKLTSARGNVDVSEVDPTDIVNAEPDIWVYSETFTLGNLQSSVTFQRSGNGACYVQKRANSSSSWSGGNNSETLTAGQQLRFMARSSNTLGASASCLYTASSTSTTIPWVITTTAGTESPTTDLAFADISDAEPTATYQSESVVIDGVTGVTRATLASSSLDGAWLYKNGAQVGTTYVRNGDTLQLQAKVRDGRDYFGTSGTATLTVGGKTGTWKLTRSSGVKSLDPVAAIPDDATPTAPSTTNNAARVVSGFVGRVKLSAADSNAKVMGDTYGATTYDQAKPGATVRLYRTTPSTYDTPYSYAYQIGNQTLTWSGRTLAFAYPSFPTISDLLDQPAGGSVTTADIPLSGANGAYTVSLSVPSDASPTVYEQNSSWLSSTSSKNFSSSATAMKFSVEKPPQGQTVTATVTLSSSYAPSYSTSFQIGTAALAVAPNQDFVDMAIPESTLTEQVQSIPLAGTFGSTLKLSMVRLSGDTTMTHAVCAASCSGFAGSSSTATVTNIDPNAGGTLSVKFTMPSTVRVALSASYRITLESTVDATAKKTWDITVSRPAAPVRVEPSFAFTDMVVAEGATAAQSQMYSWGGTINTATTFRISQVSGSGPTDFYVCTTVTCPGTSMAIAETGSYYPIGIRFNMPSTAYTPVDATYLVELVSTVDSSVSKSWTVHVTRPATPITVSPSFDFTDMALAEGTTGTQSQSYAWGGSFNTPMTFSIRQLSGSGPTDANVCTGGSCTGGSSSTATYSRDVPATGATPIVIKFTMPSKPYTPVDATYLVELTSRVDTSVKKSWTVRVTRPATPILVEPTFSFGDMAVAQDTTASQTQFVPWGGSFTGLMTMTLTKTAGSGPTAAYICLNTSTNCTTTASYASVPATGWTGIGVKFDMPSKPYTAVDATYQLDLVSNLDSSVKKTWTIHVTRPAAPITVAPSFAFTDMAVPAGTTSAQTQAYAWGGSFNTPMTYKLTRISGSGPTYAYFCLNSLTSCGSVGGSQATFSYSPVPTSGWTGIGVRFYMPTVVTTPVDATYLIELISNDDTSVKATWTVRVTRPTS